METLRPPGVTDEVHLVGVELGERVVDDLVDARDVARDVEARTVVVVGDDPLVRGSRWRRSAWPATRTAGPSRRSRARTRSATPRRRAAAAADRPRLRPTARSRRRSCRNHPTPEVHAATATNRSARRSTRPAIFDWLVLEVRRIRETVHRCTGVRRALRFGHDPRGRSGPTRRTHGSHRAAGGPSPPPFRGPGRGHLRAREQGVRGVAHHALPPLAGILGAARGRMVPSRPAQRGRRDQRSRGRSRQAVPRGARRDRVADHAPLPSGPARDGAGGSGHRQAARGVRDRATAFRSSPGSRRPSGRGSWLRDVDPDLLVDLLSGPLFYRQLLRRERTSDERVVALVTSVLSVARRG